MLIHNNIAKNSKIQFHIHYIFDFVIKNMLIIRFSYYEKCDTLIPRSKSLKEGIRDERKAIFFIVHDNLWCCGGVCQIYYPSLQQNSILSQLYRESGPAAGTPLEKEASEPAAVKKKSFKTHWCQLPAERQLDFSVQCL